MINLSTKIHDKFTLEFKVGFVTEKAQQPMKTDDFVMNMWIFVPNSLDINASKYSKEDFYRDLKTDERLITPDFPLHDLANDPQLLPNQSLTNDFNDLFIAPDDTSDLQHSLKMYSAIAKSAFRDTCALIMQEKDAEQCLKDSQMYLEDVVKVMERFRSLYSQLKSSDIKGKIVQDFAYADEFLSNIVEKYTFRLRDHLRHSFPDDYKTLEPQFKSVLMDEIAYKQQEGYLAVKANDPNGNEEFVFRSSLLKKFAESDLYLNSNKRKNTFLIEQILYSAAAGLAMIFATLSSFFFQQKYGNFTLPFLIALVISYMFKDRLKDWLRLIFAQHVSSYVFDMRTDFTIKGKYIGWSKDSIDFVNSQKLRPEVMQMRARHPLFEEVSGHDEKVMLFRKKVQLWPYDLAKVSPFPIKGINSILRYNITEFVRKMDNPNFPLAGTWYDTDYQPIEGKKIYYLTFVIQCIFEGQTEYKRVVVKCDRNGILAVV